MKKTLFLAMLLAAVVVSCKKSDDDDDSGGGGPVIPQIGPVPAAFTQKAMLEEFTGTWCGYCPRGATEAEELIVAHGDKFIAVAIHSGSSSEIMKIAEGAKVDDLFNDYGYPGGMINRAGNPVIATNSWPSKVTSELAKVATSGLAIDARAVTNTDSVTVTVHAGFNAAITGDHRLHVYIVEGSVINSSSQYNQSNYMGQGCSSPDPSSPWYTFPCSINNFDHKHVLRMVLTPGDNAGDIIPAASMAAGQQFVKSYKVSIAGMDKADLTVVAFIDKFSATKSGHQVLNIQQVKVGEMKDWD